MTTKKSNVLVLGGLALTALIAFAANSYMAVKDFGNKLKFQITGFSIPSITNSVVQAPLTLRLINPVNFGVELSNLAITIDLKQADGTFRTVSTINHPNKFIIPANGSTDLSLQPTLNLTNLNIFKGKSLNEFFNDLVSNQPLATFKINYSGLADGVEVRGSQEKQVNLPTINF